MYPHNKQQTYYYLKMSCGCSSSLKQQPACGDRCAVTGNTVTRVLRCDGRFCTLLRLIEKAGLTETVDGAESITLFAPTDAAFDKLSEATMCCLCNNPEQLRKVLLTHVLDGARTISQLAMAPPQKWTTLSGAEITLDFRSNPSRAVVIDPLMRCANITDNLNACNAIIHVVSTVLFPCELCCVKASATTCCGSACQCVPRALGAPVVANNDAAAAAAAGQAAQRGGGGCGCKRN